MLILGSEEERGDVLQAYEEGKGSVSFLHEHIMASSYEDEPRFIEIVNKAIEEGSVEEFDKWKKATGAKAIKARRKAAEKEAKEAEEMSKDLGLKKPLNGMDESDLGKLIRQRQQGRMDSLLEKLEADARKGGKKVKRDEPTEEEFAHTRAKAEGRKSKKQKSK
jgi:DnaJ family protein C protein 9